jgi:hypothetical protein
MGPCTPFEDHHVPRGTWCWQRRSHDIACDCAYGTRSPIASQYRRKASRKIAPVGRGLGRFLCERFLRWQSGETRLPPQIRMSLNGRPQFAHRQLRQRLGVGFGPRRAPSRQDAVTPSVNTHGPHASRGGRKWAAPKSTEPPSNAAVPSEIGGFAKRSNLTAADQRASTQPWPPVSCIPLSVEQRFAGQ